jgi:hypothetical protein
MTPHTHAPRIVGWREWLVLPELQVQAIKAKIDSGARSSALHVVWQKRTVHAGAPWVRFALEPDGSSAGIVESENPVIDERDVTDSGGHTTRRPFIRTPLEFAGERWPVEINLADRKRMLFPMLLGRTAMSGRLIVDPALSFTLPRLDPSVLSRGQ